MPARGPFVQEILNRLDFLERQLKRSPVENVTVVAVDQAHTDPDGTSTPVQVELEDGTLHWLGVESTGTIPPPGSKITLLMNRTDAIVAMRPGTIIEGDLRSANFPGPGLGGPGWIITAEGYLEANDAVFRGLVKAGGGPNLQTNGDFEVDISGATASAGTLSHETDTNHTHDASAGALKLVTVSESTERFVDLPPVDIDPNDLLRLTAWVKGAAAPNRAKIAARFEDADGAFIEEVEGEYVTVGAAYGQAVAQVSPPAVETGFTDFQPNQDVDFGGVGVPIDTAGNRYQNADEIALDTADYNTRTDVGALFHWWRANVGSGNLAGKTITAIEVLVDAAEVPAGSRFLFASLNIDGGFNQHPNSYDITTTPTQYAFRWDRHPDTSLPWTIADVEAFDTTDFFAFSLTPGAGGRLYRYIFRVHWQEDLPAPAKAAARIYLDPEQVQISTWRLDDIEVRKVSSVTAALFRTAELGQRVEIDSVDRNELRFFEDSGAEGAFRYDADDDLLYVRNSAGDWVCITPITAFDSDGGTRALTSYGDLTGSDVGPAVTILTGTRALVTVGCNSQSNTAFGITLMAPAISGATTRAASDTDAQGTTSAAANVFGGQSAYTALITGLTPGLNTFTAKYRNNVGTSTIGNRTISAVGLP